mgnify:CR=1 FL=1
MANSILPYKGREIQGQMSGSEERNGQKSLLETIKFITVHANYTNAHTTHTTHANETHTIHTLR